MFIDIEMGMAERGEAWIDLFERNVMPTNVILGSVCSVRARWPEGLRRIH